jgi:hypothetical protein
MTVFLLGWYNPGGWLGHLQGRSEPGIVPAVVSANCEELQRRIHLQQRRYKPRYHSRILVITRGRVVVKVRRIVGEATGNVHLIAKVPKLDVVRGRMATSGTE